jgi:F-type H+-transporting ATPase subunit delta
MTHVIVTTARSLEKTELTLVEKFVSQRFSTQFELKTIIDPAVIGGIKIQFGTEEIDATVAAKLSSVKQQLLKG